MAAVEEALQRLDEASSAAHAQGDEDAWSDDEEPGARQPAEARPAAAADEAAGPGQELSEGSAGAGGGGGGGSAGELQRVVMSKRLAGLQSRQRELEVSPCLYVAPICKFTSMSVRALHSPDESAIVIDGPPTHCLCAPRLCCLLHCRLQCSRRRLMQPQQALQRPLLVTRSQLRLQQLRRQRQRRSSWLRTTCLHQRRQGGRPAAVGQRHAAAAAAWLRLSATVSSAR
jgi:hypothetical protein